MLDPAAPDVLLHALARIRAHVLVDHQARATLGNVGTLEDALALAESALSIAAGFAQVIIQRRPEDRTEVEELDRLLAFSSRAVDDNESDR